MIGSRFDSKREKMTDAVWSSTRALAAADLTLRAVQYFVQNTEESGLCAPASAASRCSPQVNPAMDIYAGIIGYTGAILTLSCALKTVHNLRRDRRDLTTRACSNLHTPQLRGVSVLPRDQIGWAANGYSAAIMCGAHALAGYTVNESIKNSHIFRLVTGCLMGAGVTLGVASHIAFNKQVLPARMGVGRAIHQASPVMQAVTDFKVVCLLHIGASLLYSSLAAATEQSHKDPWHYHQWAAPILGAAAATSIGTAVHLIAAGIQHCRRGFAQAKSSVIVKEVPEHVVIDIPPEKPQLQGSNDLAQVI